LCSTHVQINGRDGQGCIFVCLSGMGASLYAFEARDSAAKPRFFEKSRLLGKVFLVVNALIPSIELQLGAPTAGCAGVAVLAEATLVSCATLCISLALL
jgi:hypothetical protein